MDTFKKFIDFLTVVFFGLSVFNCYGLYRAFGKYTYSLVKKSIRITLRTEGVNSILAGAFGLLSAMLIFFFPDRFPEIPVPFLLSISTLAIVRQISPALFLFLGKSEPEVIYLFGRLKRRIQPFKIIHLLEASRHGIFAQNELEFEGYRSLKHENWKTIVTEYMETAPIILLDVRYATESTIFELEHILLKNLQFKTFFIAGEYGEMPAIDMIEKKYNNYLIKESLNIVSAISVVGVLGAYTKKILEGNTPHLPIYAEIFTSRGDETKNYFHNREHQVFFEIPSKWRLEENNTPLTFFGPNGKIGNNQEYFQLIIANVLPQYISQEERIKLFDGINAYKSKFGSATNVVIAKNVTHTEISIVYKNTHYLISHANDDATKKAIQEISDTFRIG